MDDTLKKTKKLVKFMREQGILTLKTQEIEMSLAPAALFPKPESPTTSDSPEESKDPLETLLWSAPGPLELDEEHA